MIFSMIFESKKIICLFCLCFFCFAAFGYAEDSKTDIYAPVYEKPLKPTPLKDAVSQAIAFPFELIKWPIDQGLMLIEDNRLDRKAKWLYEQGVQYGFTPRLDSLDFSGIPSYGADFDLIRIARQRDDYPDLIARSWINHGPASYFQTGAELGVQRIADTGFMCPNFSNMRIGGMRLFMASVPIPASGIVRLILKKTRP